MQLRLLADENVPRPLVKLLRGLSLDVVWLPETDHRGIRDSEVVTLANKQGRIVLTRDSDFLKPSLRRRTRRGVIYIGEPVRRDNLEDLARNIMRSLEHMEEKPKLAIVTADTIELFQLET